MIVHHYYRLPDNIHYTPDCVVLGDILCLCDIEFSTVARDDFERNIRFVGEFRVNGDAVVSKPLYMAGGPEQRS